MSFSRPLSRPLSRPQTPAAATSPRVPQQAGARRERKGTKVLDQFCRDLCAEVGRGGGWGAGAAAAAAAAATLMQQTRSATRATHMCTRRRTAAQASAGRIDPITGRDAEVTRTIQILARRSKNNPILLGEPGVGKVGPLRVAGATVVVAARLLRSTSAKRGRTIHPWSLGFMHMKKALSPLHTHTHTRTRTPLTYRRPSLKAWQGRSWSGAARTAPPCQSSCSASACWS